MELSLMFLRIQRSLVDLKNDDDVGTCKEAMLMCGDSVTLRLSPSSATIFNSVCFNSKSMFRFLHSLGNAVYLIVP